MSFSVIYSHCSVETFKFICLNYSFPLVEQLYEMTEKNTYCKEKSILLFVLIFAENKLN
jgi:hypothetical protein